MLSALLHRVGGNRERVAVDPLFADGCGLTRAEHGRELKKEEHLHPPRRLRHDAHDVRQFLPVDRRHGLDDGRGKDPRNALDGVVRDVPRAHREVENLSGPHEDPF